MFRKLFRYISGNNDGGKNTACPIYCVQFAYWEENRTQYIGQREYIYVVHTFRIADIAWITSWEKGLDIIDGFDKFLFIPLIQISFFIPLI